MREGQNPAKFVGQVAQPERITAAVLSYIPFLSGFHAQTLAVLDKCLHSIRETSDLPCDLMVFDNGSGPEAVEYLHNMHEAGLIQFLVLSERNLGKGGAWNFIFNAAPGEVIAYSDSDALYHPGWLSSSMGILEMFPKAGMVTARPFRTSPDLYSSTVQWAEATDAARLERGEFIAWQDFLDFDRSLGQDDDEIRARFESTRDLRITYRGASAMIGASHFQFLAYKSVLREFLPFSMDRPMGQVIDLDRRLNESGYLRLMTTEPLVMNMSNTPEVTHRDRAPRVRRSRYSGVRRLLELKPLRYLLLATYNAIFRWYYAE